MQQFEERDRNEREHDAADPREVAGVDALKGLRQYPDAEQTHDEQRAGGDRLRISPSRAPALPRDERDRAEQQEEPQEELVRARERGERPRDLREGARALQEAVEVSPRRWDREAPPAAEAEHGVDHH